MHINITIHINSQTNLSLSLSFLSISLSLSSIYLSLYIHISYIYIYISIFLSLSLYIYIYIYIFHRLNCKGCLERGARGEGDRAQSLHLALALSLATCRGSARKILTEGCLETFVGNARLSQEPALDSAQGRLQRARNMILHLP